MKNCNARACNGGRAACPCPAACEIPDDDLTRAERALIWAIVAVAIFGIAGFFAGVIFAFAG